MDPRLAALHAALAEHGGGDGLKYGTAGFRAPAAWLPGAMHRIGVLAALRSRAAGGAAVGAMVTASHNKEPYNGAKLVEPTGAMLCAPWEAAAGAFVNARAPAALATLDAVAPKPLLEGGAHVVVARDTRASSPMLAEALARGARDAGAAVADLGVATTPQLHFAVRARHRGEPCDIGAYFAALRGAFAALVDGCAPLQETLVVDCANGVGAPAVRQIAALVPGIVIVNGSAERPLNERCGADFVQKERAPPQVYDARNADGKEAGLADGAPPLALCAALDGDADRLVFFVRSADDGGIVLADGDRFATLVAKHVAKNVRDAGLAGVSIGVAQTAYSNGAATAFLRAIQGVEVVIANTGVKYLEKAVHGFDVGIYWEPNGHGTVLYTDGFRQRLEAQSKECQASQFLLQLGRLSNQAVGDGVADLLIVVALLMRTGMKFKDWINEYKEKKVSNCVVCVQDKSVVATEDFDRRVAAPRQLCDGIEAIVGSREGVRAFVRPSGTEDVVRVFAEADSQACADQVATDVARSVFDACDGVGDRP